MARPASSPVEIDWLALYAESESGYRHLSELVSMAHLERPANAEPHVPMSALAGRTEGVIALTAGADGALVRLLAQGQSDLADTYLNDLKTLFANRLFIEIARRNNPEEIASEASLLNLAAAHGLPVVATNPCLYLDAGGQVAQTALRSIAAAKPLAALERSDSDEQAWLKPARAMQRLFADLPQAVASTQCIAERCAWVAFERTASLPSIAGDDAMATLRSRARAGLARLLDARRFVAAAPAEAYRTRLEQELDLIAAMAAFDSFLVVEGLVGQAREMRLPIGPGRGASSGSVVAWALGITRLDPIRFGLHFERFLNPERSQLPDFDLEVCEVRRGELIGYLQQTYGHDRVAQTATFGKLMARGVVKDVGRALGLTLKEVQAVADLIPHQRYDPWTVERALNGVPELAEAYAATAMVREILDLAMELEPLPRYRSYHSAAVAICDRPLSEVVPLCSDPRTTLPVSQFGMIECAAMGPMVIELFGLDTLSVHRKAVDFLAEDDRHIDLDALPLDDAETFALLARGDTAAVFGLEAAGLRRHLKRFRPASLDDIILLSAMYRPGLMERIPVVLARRAGRASIEPVHPLLDPVLAETYGLFIYQEQLMEALRRLAGFDLGTADQVRRVLGRRVKVEVDAARAQFIAGCALAHGVTKAEAKRLFTLLERSAGPGFNKAHAAAQALISYQGAWLKAHHPAEFYAASLVFERSRTKKLGLFLGEAGIADPDLNLLTAKLLLGDEVRFGSAEELGLREKLLELKQAVDNALDEHRAAHGGIGHNRPPDGESVEADIAPAIIDARVQPAIAAISQSLAAVEPDALAVARKASHLRTTLAWLGSHGGLASKEFAKAFGKTSGEEAAKALFRLPVYDAVGYALYQFLRHVDQWLLLIFR